MIDATYVENLFVAAKLSSTEREILVYLINHIDEIDRLGIRDVASSCFTSTTTVIRLAKKLGYRGFREMGFELKELSTRGFTALRGAGGMEGGRHDFTCGENDIDFFCDGLMQDGIVCLYGEGWSSIVVEYIEKKLIIHGHRTVNHDLLGTNTLLKRIPDISFGLFISKGGSTVAVAEAARRCRLAHIPVACFTGNPHGRLAQNADAVFAIKDDDPFDSENRTPNLFFARCIATFEELLAYQITRTDQ